MSKSINNREFRKQAIKEIIAKLHEGKSVDEVKEIFAGAFEGVTAGEISEAEQALISEGLPITEVQRLCDVHAAVFKGSIEEIHEDADKSLIPGHPANIFKLENRFIEKLIKTKIMPSLSEPGARGELKEAIDELAKVDLHYKRKENIFFPYLERYGITAPPKVMWGVDDEIRAHIKAAAAALEGDNAAEVEGLVRLAVSKVEEMIFKEDNILLPMLMETLSKDEWIKILKDSDEIGYMISGFPVWAADKGEALKEAAALPGVIKMPSGEFAAGELVHVLNTLPFDITFVGKDGRVKYFSEGPERIFPRTRSVIGREVSNCHPPASVGVVEKLIEDLKSGEKDSEDFWIKAGDKYILIRYFAVRDDSGEYLGVLEVTQNIKPIQDITGEKRLLTS